MIVEIIPVKARKGQRHGVERPEPFAVSRQPVTFRSWLPAACAATGNRGLGDRGGNPKGILMFDAGGQYAYFLVRGDRAKYRSPGAPTTEEITATVRDYVAGNFGTWSVNEPDKTLTQHYDGALNPNNEGTEAKTTVSLSGDELRLTTVSAGGSGARAGTVYRRAR